MSNPWVTFDGWGEQVDCTFDERFANFDRMNPSEYNIAMCTIEVVRNYDLLTGMVCKKDMSTGIITLVQRPRDYRRPVPHVPAPTPDSKDDDESP